MERLSRIAAQLAPFVTVELMPYFLNSPFSVRDDDGRAIGQGDHAEVEIRRFRPFAGAGGGGGPGAMAERGPKRGGSDARGGARDELTAIQ